ncbi:hypothetical protein [Bosea sp. ANAM02]|uniref:hypothetical protein n=1 Tax=Bosea sp. ANAM02 TaxID=2020412 RepID=UPI00140ED4DF|nr:hypothetical protein [Bosea sp. ANAM02]BCB22211.1 hypothetical protein OCUBac02_51050 [Bosea sp. ANAM02]
MVGWRASLASAVAGFGILASEGPAAAQQITVLDAQCKSEIVSACYKRQEPYRINQNQDPCGSGKLLNPDRRSCSDQAYVGNSMERCSAWFEVEQYGACLRTIDRPTQSTAASIQQELSQLNKTLRSDQRAMLNQICKSLSQRPETCDASIPAQ